ncbi:MAG TPA: cupin domain-containing protein [Aeromicrobium sp.]|nr:cupin domain-containing protein [Aeromicrobium sp.]
MESVNVLELGRQRLEAARTSGRGRSAKALHPGRHNRLRQTLIALLAGEALGEHEAPPEATLQVLSGQVRITAGDDSWQGATGDLVIIPDRRHDLHAEVDSVVLLTTIVDGAQ